MENDISVWITRGPTFSLNIKNNNYNINLPLPFRLSYKGDYTLRVLCCSTIIANIIPAKEIVHLSRPMILAGVFSMEYRKCGMICIDEERETLEIMEIYEYNTRTAASVPKHIYNLANPKSIPEAKSFIRNTFINIIRNTYKSKLYENSLRKNNGYAKSTGYT